MQVRMTQCGWCNLSKVGAPAQAYMGYHFWSCVIPSALFGKCHSRKLPMHAAAFGLHWGLRAERTPLETIAPPLSSKPV